MKRRKKSKVFPKLILGITLLSSISLGIYLSIPYISNSVSQIVQFFDFKIRKINIKGATPKVSKLIRSNIGISENDSIFKLSAEEMYDNISKISWVKAVTVRKKLPNIIELTIEEKTPIAVFQHNAESFLIDSDGNFIERITEKPKELPLVSGVNANKKVYKILDILKQYKEIFSRLEALTFVRERRWDLTLSGIKIKLPEGDITKSLEVLNILIKSEKFNRNNVDCIDLRIPDSVILNGLILKKDASV